jgi:hypothetical protein
MSDESDNAVWLIILGIGALDLWLWAVAYALPWFQ